MYDAIIGRKGSGKSYNTVATVILPALRKGRTVVTNIPLTDEIQKDKELIGTVVQFDINDLQWYEEPVYPQATKDFFDPDKIIKGAVYVLDEVHKLWPSGLKVNEFPKEQKNFISENRHMVGENGYSTDIVLVTQDTTQIAAYPRRILDKIYICRKLDAIGLKNRYRVNIYEGEVSLNETFKGQKLNTFTGKYDPKIFKYYKSHTQNDSDYTEGLEETNSNSTIWKSPIFTIGLPFSIIAIVYAAYSVLNSFSSQQLNPNAPTEPQTEQKAAVIQPVHTTNEQHKEQLKPQTQQTEIQPTNTNDESYYSEQYRISHWTTTTTPKIVYITNNTKTYPYPFDFCEIKPFDGLTCDFNGELVTTFSGMRPTYEKSKNSLNGTLN